MQNWHHQLLGDVTRDPDGLPYWAASVHVPAFDAFSSDHASIGGTTNPYRLLLAGDEESPSPPNEAVALAVRLLERQAYVAEVIANALWDDLNGRGPDSPMWWHGTLSRNDPDEQSHFVSRLPAAPADVMNLLRLKQILIDDAVPGQQGWVIYLELQAAFEQEHGLGILTDTDRVLGAGYVGEFTRYEGL